VIEDSQKTPSSTWPQGEGAPNLRELFLALPGPVPVQRPERAACIMMIRS
jgi:hypothetical protein